MGMKARILVVDDDEQLLKLLDQVLSGLGVEVCAVEWQRTIPELRPGLWDLKCPHSSQHTTRGNRGKDGDESKNPGSR